MRRRWLVPRFSIRTLLIAVALVAVGLWWFYTLPVYMRNRADRVARASIDPYELAMAGRGDPAAAPAELVTILGDSRLKHWAGAWDVQFVDTTTLMSHGRDQTVRFWDIKTGKQRRVLPAEFYAFSGDGSTLFFVSPSKADAIEIWDAVAWKQKGVVDLKVGRPCTGLVANGDGSRFAAAIGVGRESRQVQVWDAAKRALIREYAAPQWTRRTCPLDDAGKRLALYDGKLVTVMDVDSGEVLGKAGPFRFEKYDAQLHHCLFLPTTLSQIITGDAGGQVVIWNYETGEEVDRLPKTPATTEVLVFEPRNPNLFVGDGSNVYEYALWGDQWRLWGEVTPDAAGFASDVAYRNGTLALAGSSIVLEPRLLSVGKRPHVTHLAFDPRGRYLATASPGGEISIWEMQSWEHLRTWPADVQRLSQLAFTPDGSALVSLGDQDTVVWDFSTGAEQVRITTGGNHPRQFAISPDGRLLASTSMRAGPTHVIQLWNLADGTVNKTVVHRSVRRRGQLFFVGNSDTLVMGGGKGMTVWDLANSKLTANLGSKTLHDVPLAVHPDGRRVAMQPWSGPIEIWNIATQKLILSSNVHGGKILLNSIAIHPSGQRAASAGEEGAVCLWDFDTGVVIKKWQLGPPKGIVHQVAFSPDGRYLATVNGNGTAYILRLDEAIER